MLVTRSVPDRPKSGEREEGGVRIVAIVGWVVIVGSLLAWQGFGLVNAPEWPTLSQLFRDFMQVPFGRPALFGLWLWLGWHLFARGAGSLFGA